MFVLIIWDSNRDLILEIKGPYCDPGEALAEVEPGGPASVHPLQSPQEWWPITVKSCGSMEVRQDKVKA